MRAHGLELVQKHSSAVSRDDVSGWERPRSLRDIEGRRRAEEDRSLDKHVKTFPAFVISVSVWLPCASIVKNAFVELLQEREVGGRAVEELSAFARVRAVVVSGRYSTIYLRIGGCIMVSRRVNSW